MTEAEKSKEKIQTLEAKLRGVLQEKSALVAEKAKLEVWVSQL